MWIKKEDYKNLKESEEFWRKEAARMNKQLIEQQRIENKLKAIEKTGDDVFDRLVERLCRLEVKADMQDYQDYPYFI